MHGWEGKGWRVGGRMDKWIDQSTTVIMEYIQIC